MNSAKELDALVQEWKAQGMSKASIVVNEAEATIGWPYVWGATGQDCTVAKREYYMNRSAIGPGDAELIRKRCQQLNGTKSSCTGCKYYPDGERTRIQDCQGFAKEMFKAVGITLSGGGCTSMWGDNRNWQEKGEIGNMPMDKVCCVFKHIKATGKMDHMGIHIGGGEIVHCSVEVKRGKTTEKGWTHYAIPKGMDGGIPVSKPTLRKGATGPYVVECQEDLMKLGYDLSPYNADGKYGTKTMNAVKAFQAAHGLTADGITGPRTWEALDAAVGPQPEPGEDRYTVKIEHVPRATAEEIISRYGGEMTKEG